MQEDSLRKHLQSWLLAARPLTLTASATPVLIGAALAAEKGPLDWSLFALAFCGAVLIQVGANLADEYTDHRRSGGVPKFPAPHKVIQRGLLSERAVLWGAHVSFALATAMGLYIVSEVGWPILVVGIFSLLAGYLHSSGPFPLGDRALGLPTVFVFMGPVIVMSSYYVQVQQVTWSLFWASAPIGLLVTAILQANDLRDLDEDRRSGKRTLTTILGAKVGRLAYLLLLDGAYLSLLAVARYGELPSPSLLAWLTFPWALSLVRRLEKAEARPALNEVMLGAARLHLATGLLMALGIALHATFNP